MTTMILIRHGESEANRNNYFAGQIDPDLQEKGVKQAMLTADFIAKNFEVDRIYSSDLTRAYKTARCLNDIVQKEIVVRRNLREIYAGEWEGMKFEEIFSKYPEEFAVWMEDISSSVCPNGESVREMGERTFSAFEDIAKENDGKVIAVATHATPIRAFLSMVKKGDFSMMQELGWVSNASVTVAEYSNGEWKIILESEDSHLENLKTNLPDNV